MGAKSFSHIQIRGHLASLRIRMLPLVLFSLGMLGWVNVAAAVCNGALLGSMDEVQRNLTAVCGGQTVAAQTQACTLWRTCLNPTTPRDMCDPYAIKASMCLDAAAAEDCKMLEMAFPSPEERTACLSSLANKMADPMMFPSMKMYLHQRVGELVIWKEWIPSNTGQYVGTLIAVMLFGVVSTGTKVYRSRLEASWIGEALEGHRSVPFPLETLKQNSIKAALTFVATLIDYANMLVVMTFNVGLLFAVTTGYALGTLLLSHLAMPHAKPGVAQGAIILADVEKGQGGYFGGPRPE